MSKQLSLKDTRKRDIYSRLMIEWIEKYPLEKDDREALKKFCFYSIKYIRAMRWSREDTRTLEQTEAKFTLACFIADTLAMLTPHEFIQVFPVHKRYDGYKLEMKDYLSTMEAVKEYDMNAPIGDDKIGKFLWDYYNWDITEFVVEKMCVASNLRRFQGEKGIMEEFCDKNGIETFTHYMKEGYLRSNRTGKITKLSKPKKRLPKQFKVVK